MGSSSEGVRDRLHYLTFLLACWAPHHLDTMLGQVPIQHRVVLLFISHDR